MKIVLDYDVLKDKCIKLANELKDKNFDEVVAVSRGGLTIAHIMAKVLKLPVGVYYPSTDWDTARLFKADWHSNNFLIVEDLVAEGRTLKELKSFFSVLPEYNYTFVPFLVDANYKGDIEYYAMKTSDWIVFPWEEDEKMIEGDRGLFRDGSDNYGE